MFKFVEVNFKLSGKEWYKSEMAKFLLDDLLITEDFYNYLLSVSSFSNVVIVRYINNAMIKKINWFDQIVLWYALCVFKCI